MATSQLDAWDNASDLPEIEPGEMQIFTRRALLRAAASGFTLAASGLLLPAGVEDAAAREGALGGEKGGRRGRNQRGRHKRRHNHRQRDRHSDKRNDAPGYIGYKNIKFQFEVSGGKDAYVKLFEFIAGGWDEPVLDYWGTYAPGKGDTFKAFNRIAALQVDHHLWIKAENTLIPWENPQLWLGFGGSFGSREPLTTGTAKYLSVLSEGGTSAKLEMDGYSLQAVRQNDDEDRKVFKVTIVTPSA